MNRDYTAHPTWGFSCWCCCVSQKKEESLCGFLPYKKPVSEPHSTETLISLPKSCLKTEAVMKVPVYPHSNTLLIHGIVLTAYSFLHPVFQVKRLGIHTHCKLQSLDFKPYMTQTQVTLRQIAAKNYTLLLDYRELSRFKAEELPYSAVTTKLNPFLGTLQQFCKPQRTGLQSHLYYWPVAKPWESLIISVPVPLSVFVMPSYTINSPKLGLPRCIIS